MSNSNMIEWARLDADSVLIATATRAWVLPAKFEAALGIFAGQMVGPGSVPTTTKLLKGAVKEARKRTRSPHSASQPDEQQLITLAVRCHLAHATSLLMSAAARFYAEGRVALAAWAAKTARQEREQSSPRLSELRAFGRHADERSFGTVVAMASALTEYLRHCVQGSEPIGCVGYAYAIQSLSRDITEGNIGAMVATLSPEDRCRIAVAAYDTTLLYRQLCSAIIGQKRHGVDAVQSSNREGERHDGDAYSGYYRKRYCQENRAYIR